jgi:hypothetical protein
MQFDFSSAIWMASSVSAGVAAPPPLAGRRQSQTGGGKNGEKKACAFQCAGACYRRFRQSKSPCPVVCRLDTAAGGRFHRFTRAVADAFALERGLIMTYSRGSPRSIPRAVHPPAPAARGNLAAAGTPPGSLPEEGGRKSPGVVAHHASAPGGRS